MKVQDPNTAGGREQAKENYVSDSASGTEDKLKE